jgi:hypothetical protein
MSARAQQTLPSAAALPGHRQLSCNLITSRPDTTLPFFLLENAAGITAQKAPAPALLALLLFFVSQEGRGLI